MRQTDEPRTQPENSGEVRAQPVKILYIVGWKRSGSTILGSLLGELDGFFHAGELRTLWGKGLLEGRRCGCGIPVRDCPFWTSVLSDAMGNVAPDVSPVRIFDWQKQAVRSRFLVRLLRTAPGRPTGWTPMDRYANATGCLYRAIAHAARARVVVDSSKQHADAALTRLVPGIDAYFVHLVRDPRAVAYSWSRQKASPGEGPHEEMMRLGPTASARNWDFVNLAAELLRRRHGSDRSMLVRYEDLIDRPRAILGAIAELMGEPASPLPFLDDHRVQLRPNHTAGGNPDRFRSGPVDFRKDNDWLAAQPARDRLITTAVCLPLLGRYGYQVFSRRASR